MGLERALLEIPISASVVTQALRRTVSARSASAACTRILSRPVSGLPNPVGGHQLGNARRGPRPPGRKHQLGDGQPPGNGPRPAREGASTQGRGRARRRHQLGGSRGHQHTTVCLSLKVRPRTGVCRERDLRGVGNPRSVVVSPGTGLRFAVVLETPVKDAARREGIFSSSIDRYVVISVSWTGARPACSLRRSKNVAVFPSDPKCLSLLQPALSHL
jgi:hypothetical protein